MSARLAEAAAQWEAVRQAAFAREVGPTSEPIVRDDGSVGWVVIHHSLDGREGASV